MDSPQRFRIQQYPVHQWSTVSCVWCPGFCWLSLRAIWTSCHTKPWRGQQPRNKPGPCFGLLWHIHCRPWPWVLTRLSEGHLRWPQVGRLPSLPLKSIKNKNVFQGPRSAYFHTKCVLLCIRRGYQLRGAFNIGCQWSVSSLHLHLHPLWRLFMGMKGLQAFSVFSSFSL